MPREYITVVIEFKNFCKVIALLIFCDDNHHNCNEVGRSQLYPVISSEGDESLGMREDARDNLERLMNVKKLSAYKLSELSGVSQPAISLILAGSRSPNLDTLEKLGNALGVPPFAMCVPGLHPERMDNDVGKVAELINKLNPKQFRELEKYAEFLLSQADK